MPASEVVKLTFLGTGTSHGVPMLGCSCRTCQSSDPRDKRSNASILLSVGGKNILIDCGRDFHQQALRHHLDRVDYLLLTHVHFDHTGGIDDLRAFRKNFPIPLLGKAEHLSYLKRYIYHYLFDRSAQKGGGLTQLEPIAIDDRFQLEGIQFEVLPVFHGELEIIGFKFLNCAYISDVSHIPKEVFERLYDLDLLILDALRYRSHSTHFNVGQALEIVRQLKPRQTFFTHICHDIRHQELEAVLQDPQSEYYTELSVRPACDGLVLTL